MPVTYKITQVKNKLTSEGEPCYSVTITGRRKVSFEKMKDQISLASSVTPSDIIAVIEALTYEIASTLQNGYTVTIEGLGTFYLSAEPHSKITDPQNVTSRSIKLKKIGFKADRRFKSKFSSIEFIKDPNEE